jgi:hypothetical protein
MQRTIDVLSGGGAKGISQVQYLVKAERDSGGVPYCKTRDMIVGTSVGSINAGIMASGKITADDLNAMYKELIRKIFTHKPWYKFPKTPLYDKQSFIDVWDSVIGNGFLMGDCKTKLMTTSVNVVEDELGCDRNVFFKSWKEEDGNRRLVDVIVNSFSAPLYFGFTCRPDEQRVYGDGGIGANNLALDDARTELDIMGWYDNGNNVMLNAVGCLYSVDPRKQDYNTVCKQNTIKQVLDFFAIGAGGMARSMSLSDQLRKTSYVCSYKKSISFRYWDALIPKDADSMDKLKYLDLYIDKGREMSMTPKISIN